MDIVVLNMVFDNNHVPDFGSMEIGKNNTLHLLSADISKLNSTLTRAVCVGEYGADNFSFQTGDTAIIDDAPMQFIYHSKSDRWHDRSEAIPIWHNPDDKAAGWIEFRLFKNGVAYVLEDDEKIICLVVKKSDNTVLMSKALLKWHYKGGGYYNYDLSRQEIETVLAVQNDFKFSISICKGENETDITSEFTCKDVLIMNLIYDEDYDGGDENAE